MQIRKGLIVLQSTLLTRTSAVTSTSRMITSTPLTRLNSVPTSLMTSAPFYLFSQRLPHSRNFHASSSLGSFSGFSVARNRSPVLSSSLPSSCFASPSPSVRFFASSPFSASVASSSTGPSSVTTSAPIPEQFRPGQRAVGYWLIVCSGMVFVMVVLGGVTRLTESGLSIVEWKPVTGMIPPREEKEWEAEFQKYKQSPEFQKLNFEMSLQEFKRIFYMEWAHRAWGRIIGMTFALPFAYFVARGYIRGAREIGHYFGLFALGGAQGALGWYMVKSGLNHKDFEKDNSVPRVSHYRLAAHLSLAVALYLAMLYRGQKLLSPAMYAPVPGLALKTIKKGAVAALGLTSLTALTGAFVAGRDAGLIYNTFPKMGDDWIPQESFSLKPLWRNFLENDTTIQLQHRIMGITTGVYLTGFWAYVMRSPAAASLPPRVRLALHSTLAVVAIQVGLGISTLLAFVPVPLAASHQAGAMTLLTVVVWLIRQLNKIPK